MTSDGRWAWNYADKDKDGAISSKELVSVISKYKAYLKAQPDILKLISEHDSNHDNVLDENEMLKLLKVLVLRKNLLENEFRCVDDQESCSYLELSGSGWESAQCDLRRRPIRNERGTEHIKGNPGHFRPEVHFGPRHSVQSNRYLVAANGGDAAAHSPIFSGHRRAK